jgi:hypothetical protein
MSPSELVPAARTQAMADRPNVFVSYASEDFARTKTVPRHGFLEFYVDSPERRPPSRIRDVLRDNLKDSWHRLRRRGIEVPRESRKSADQIRAELEERMDQARAMLVLWSGSHRGSAWAGYEVSYFQTQHPDRPVFCVVIDHTPAPRDWRFLGDAGELTPERLKEAASAPPGRATRGLQSSDVTIADALRRPDRWSASARRWKVGTSIPELLHLKRKALAVDGVEEKAFLVRARRLALSICLAMAVALLLGMSLLLRLWPDDPVFARHAALAASLAWTCLAMAAIQASVVSALPAALLATIVGIGVEIALARFTHYKDGGAAAAASLGTFMGVLVCYEYRLGAPGASQAHVVRASWAWAAKNVLAGLGLAMVLAVGVIVLIAPARGHITGPRVPALALLLGVLPFAAVWAEVSRLGRLREFLRLGRRPACLLALVFVTLGVTIWLVNPSVHHGRPYSGFVAGGVAGLCVGSFYLGAGFLLGMKVTSEVRALASTSAVTFGLGALAVALPILNPPDDLNHEVGIICATYAAAFVASAVAARNFLKVRA